jgi:hypothetical protein
MDRGNDYHRDFQFLPIALFSSSPRVSYGNQPKALVAGNVCHVVIAANIV